MPGRPSIRTTRVPTRRRRQTRARKQTIRGRRVIDGRPQSTYGSNTLRKPRPSRPGASLGQGRGPVGQVHQRKNTLQRAKIGGVKYTNYRIGYRNPMDD